MERRSCLYALKIRKNKSLMKVVLFDLGNTLEDQQRGVLLPGARETHRAIQTMKDAQENPPVLALISDFDMPSSPDEIPVIRERYVLQ